MPYIRLNAPFFSNKCFTATESPPEGFRNALTLELYPPRNAELYPPRKDRHLQLGEY